MTSKEILPINKRLHEDYVIDEYAGDLLLKYHEALESSERKIEELETDNKLLEGRLNNFYKLFPEYQYSSKPIEMELHDRVIGLEKKLEIINGLIKAAYLAGFYDESNPYHMGERGLKEFLDKHDIKE